MENVVEVSKNEVLTCEKTVDIKEHQSFNESNLMTLPFISLKRKRVPEINRTWIRDGQEINLQVKGGAEFGCPTIYELDVLMGLFKIQAKAMDNKLVVLNSKTVDSDGEVLNSKYSVQNIPKVINFTYRGLAREMELKGFGKATKERLEKSIKCLVECTVYSTLAIRNQEQGEYIIDFNGLESTRILKNYKSYNVSKWKKADKKLLDPTKIEEFQSIEIDSINSQRIFFIVIDKILKTNQRYTELSVKEFVNRMDINGNSMYERFGDFAKELSNIKIGSVKIFEYCDYDNYAICVNISNKVMNLIKSSKNNSHFNNITVNEILELKTVKTLPIITKLNASNQISVSIDELKSLLKIENSYNNYSEFKRNVLNKIMKDLKSIGLKNVVLREIKSGKKIKEIVIENKIL